MWMKYEAQTALDQEIGLSPPPASRRGGRNMARLSGERPGGQLKAEGVAAGDMGAMDGC